MVVGTLVTALADLGHYEREVRIDHKDKMMITSTLSDRPLLFKAETDFATGD